MLFLVTCICQFVERNAWRATNTPATSSRSDHRELQKIPGEPRHLAGWRISQYRRHVVTWDKLAIEGNRLGHEGKEANDMAARRHT